MRWVWPRRPASPQSRRTPARRSVEQLGDALGGAARAVGLDWAIVDLAADVLDDRLGDRLRWRVLEVHSPSGPVALQAMVDVEVLLEVMLQGEIDERRAVRGQLHRRRQAALHHRQIAGRQMLVE